MKLANHQTLLQAIERPYVLDDHTVARVLRVLRVFGEQAADHWLFEEQLRRWAAGPLTPPGGGASERRGGPPAGGDGVHPRPGRGVQGRDIERLLTKSDLEVGRTTAMAASISGAPRGGG